MILDAQLELCNLQAFTTSAADSEDVIDLSAVASGAGAGVESRQVVPVLNVVVGTTFTSAGAGTLAVAVRDSPDDSTYTTKFTTLALAKGTLVKGYKIIQVTLPKLQRYLKLTVTIAVADMTAGAINAYISLDPEQLSDV